MQEHSSQISVRPDTVIMMETDHLNETHGIGREDGSPNHPAGKPMRQLEFNQAMSDFRHMFPETDEEVIEAVLRANSGMVDATIDQLLTMNIDAEQVREMYEDGDDLPDHILMSVEQEVMAQEHANRESRSKKRQQSDLSEKTNRKELEDCPPSYTEAVKSHISHHHRSSNHRHRHSPTSSGLTPTTSPKNNAVNNRSGSHHHHHHRYPRNGMQHLLDLGPESAPGVAAPPVPVDGQGARQQPPQQHSKYHTHHHSQRASNHHRRRGDSMDSVSPHKSRPGRNLLASNSMSSSHSPFSPHLSVGSDEMGFPRPRKSSLDSSDFNLDTGRDKSPSRWHSSRRERTSPKRPAFRNWNPPLLGTLPDDFLRITPVTNPIPSQSVSFRPGKQGNTHLHRAFSAVGPERPKFSTAPAPEPRPIMSTSQFHPPSKQKSSNKPHRSLSFAGHSSEPVLQRKLKPPPHPSGLAQHEFSPDFLQERMLENERRRLRMGSSGLDPELAQYLADERLAIMLQNSEFLQELRCDHQFMMTLERDHKDVEEGITRPEVVPEPSSPVGLNSDEEEGYGEDRRDTLEAFPFTQQLPSTKNEDVELRKKLKHMGKASRKQFAALARKFFAKRKKKTAHQILKESQAPSMMNLLDEDDDQDIDDAESGEAFGSSSHYGQYDQDSHSPRTSSWNERHHDDL